MKTSLLLLAIITLATSALPAADAPKPGSVAPDFSLTDTAGKAHSLAALKGKYVVLEWFNPGCPFVKKHYGSGNMQKLQQEYTGKGVAWLTIDSGAPGLEGSLTAEEGTKAIADLKIHSTALLLDGEGKVGHLYGAKNTPDMVVINPEGKVIYDGAIDSKATADPGDIASATNYVKAALDEAMAGKPVSVPSARPYGCSVKYAK